MTTFVAGTRFFVGQHSGKVIACPPITDTPKTGNVLYSPDGKIFYVVLGSSGSSYSVGGKYLEYNFYFEVPKLDLSGAKLVYDGETNTVIYDVETYKLDESFDPANATIVGLAPKMRVITLVSTHGGFIVEAQNQVDNKTYLYYNGQPATMLPGSVRARGDAATLLFDDHRLDISGDHLDMTRQYATLDGQPAEVLIPDYYEVSFADDLSTVTVSKK